MTNSNNKTSLLVSSQLPEFVREEHTTFIKFLEYYYKFLEQDGQTMYVAKNFLQYLDLDTLTEHIYEQHFDNGIREHLDYHGFLQKLYDNYIKFIPDSVVVDKTLLVKHAKEFYRSRGTEKSLRFLLRALFNKEVEFYYPKTDILRASDGKWFIEKSLRVTNLAVNNVSNTIAVSNFVNKKITGLDTGATAFVERIDTYFDKGQLVYELKLSNLYREFQDPESIFCFYTEDGIDKYLSANLFSGVITAVTLNQGGSLYTAGTTIPINTSTGSGAQIVISRVSAGAVQAVGVVDGGAGFQVNDSLVLSGGGFGAAGSVANVNSNGFYHPNSYNVMWTTISLEANTRVNNTKYSNLVSSITDPANAWITNSMSYFVYANCGPAISCQVSAGGNNYSPPISISISANSIITKLGILGKMMIANPGTGYANGNLITFENKLGSTGSGALGYVNVNATGAIVSAKFVPVRGQITGGSGYDWFNLPVANVVSGTGTGGNVIVTAVIGQNEELTASLSNIGTIQEITVVSGGSQYQTGDTLSLDTLGDGTANATLTIVSGAVSYPGRYINDDGHLSGYNFLEDRDYYQPFSYVVKVDETINKYRATVKDLTHPAGSKMFGEYSKVFDRETLSNTNVSITYANTESNTVAYDTLYQVQGFMSGTFAPTILVGNANAEIVFTSFTMNVSNQLTKFIAQNNSIVIGPYFNNGYTANDKIFLWFQTNASPNISNTNYTVTSANNSHIIITNPLTETVTGNVGNVRVFNPDIIINMSQSIPENGTNVYLQWAGSLRAADASLANGFYTVYNSSNPANTFTVSHPNMITAVSAANSVNVITRKIQVTTVSNHEYTAGEQVYLLFLAGDTGNTRNGYYTITDVKSNVSFNVAHQNTILSSSGSRVFQKRSKIVISGTNSFANGNTIYVSYASGDTGNTTNSTYSAIKVAADTLTFNTARPATANATVRVWSSQNSYTNVRFTTRRTTSGLGAGNTIYVEFFAPDTALANGIYNVRSVYSSNSYNISYSGANVVSSSRMEGSALVSLYK